MLSWTQTTLPSTVHCAVDGAGHSFKMSAERCPVSGSVKLKGFCDIQIGSLTCSLKMTSGHPALVRFHNRIFACSDVAPLPSPSYVTIFIFTPGCATWYALAAGSRAASTQTVKSPDAAAAPDPDGAGAELVGVEGAGVGAEADVLGAGEEPPLELDEQAARARADAARATGSRTSPGRLRADERRTVIMCPVPSSC